MPAIILTPRSSKLIASLRSDPEAAAWWALTPIARCTGIDKTIDVGTEDELSRAYDRILGEDGPFVVCVKIVKGRAEGRFERDVVGYARRFKEALAAR